MQVGWAFQKIMPQSEATPHDEVKDGDQAQLYIKNLCASVNTVDTHHFHYTSSHLSVSKTKKALPIIFAGSHSPALKLKEPGTATPKTV
jgi:hypothetical protein